MIKERNEWKECSSILEVIFEGFPDRRIEPAYLPALPEESYWEYARNRGYQGITDRAVGFSPGQGYRIHTGNSAREYWS